MSGIKPGAGSYWMGGSSGGLVGGSYAPTKPGYVIKNPFVTKPTYYQPGEAGYVFRPLSPQQTNIRAGEKLKQILKDYPDLRLDQAQDAIRSDWIKSWPNGPDQPYVRVYPTEDFSMSTSKKGA